jgi:hypothetical protein
MLYIAQGFATTEAIGLNPTDPMQLNYPFLVEYGVRKGPRKRPFLFLPRDKAGKSLSLNDMQNRSPKKNL